MDLDPQNIIIMEIPVYFEMNVSVNHETNIVINTFFKSFNINYTAVVCASALSWCNRYICV